MVDPQSGPSWQLLWQRLDGLDAHARMLRRLSQEEPLLQARPDYPRPPLPKRSYAAELRETLEGIRRRIDDVLHLLPEALPGSEPPAGGLDEDAPAAIAQRLGTLAKFADTLLVEAFEPLPPLPKHAPPYVLQSPRRDLAGSKAVSLSYGLEEVAAAIRNALLSRTNTGVAST